MKHQVRRRAAGGTVAALWVLCSASAAWAQQKAFDIPASEAVKSIPEFARQAGVQIVAPADDLDGIKTRPVQGQIDAREALRRLLIGTGLEIAADDGSIITLRKKPSDADAARTAEVSEVIVTGSRLKRAEVEGASPVVVITREKIERTGAATLTDALRNALPIQSNSISDHSNSGNVGTGQSNVNLRGLGNGATLTLVNGRRFALSGNSRINGGNVYNINAIPMGAIERIEVLKDGASAIYGSDAIAGVVNIILRKDYDGTEINLSYNNTFDTDSGIVNGSVTSGVSGERGSGLLTVEMYRQNSMMGSDRDFSASADQRSRGGLDMRVFPGTRGTVYAMPNQTLPGVFLANGQPATFAAIPAGQDGTALTAADFNATAGVRDLLNQNAYMTTVPERNTINVIGSFDYRITDEVTLFGQTAYSHTNSYALIPNAGQVSLGQLVIPASNPYNPFGVDVRVEKNIVTEYGDGKRSNDYDDYGVIGGLRGRWFGGWEWETAFNYGESNTQNGFNPYHPSRGTTNAASTDPAVAFNWFGDAAVGAVNDATKIAVLQGYELGRGLGKLSMVDATLRGELFSLFGNPVQAAIGSEYRRDEYEQAYVSNASDAFRGVLQAQTRTTKSLFAEVDVPLITPRQDVPLVSSLELSLAARYEDLGRYGETTDPRVGLRWQIVPSFMVRASIGTSFRAPTANEAGSAPLTFVRSAIDPLRGNQMSSFTTYEYAALELRPETSENFSAGLLFEPAGMLHGLSASVDYYRIDYQDKFAYLFPEQALQYGDAFGRYVTRAAPSAQDIAQGWAGPISAISLGYVNLAGAKVSGLDFDVNYGWDTWLGKFNFSVLGTHTLKFDETFAPGQGVVHRLGEYTYPKKWQGLSSLFLTRGALDAGVTFRYVHSYSITGYGVFNPARKIDAIKEFDVHLSYRLPEQVRISAGVINVFDREPPYFYAPVTYSGNFGFDATLSSPRQATYHLSVRKSF
ncbi:TonB-dependent receptor [Peristeroidobacter soli]|uniref:TonB-dependent receptor n=1 Tax=Peristeroidobacter soli TaxID=2497877 RepID=UPI00101B60B6|nr:TonB-dependent receptor [Peristeroidobacter soli]